MKRRDPGAGRGRRTQPRPLALLVYCGALSTEPTYLDGLRAMHADAPVNVRIRARGVDPRALVRLAAAHRDRHPGAFDEVWCVVDVDDFDIDAAAEQARAQGVNLVVSNPCFELWLLLHHADCRSHCDGAADVTARLRRHVPDYDKTRLRFDDFADGIADAVKRAKVIEPSGANCRLNPSTGVWRLVEQIQEATR